MCVLVTQTVLVKPGNYLFESLLHKITHNWTMQHFPMSSPRHTCQNWFRFLSRHQQRHVDVLETFKHYYSLSDLVYRLHILFCFWGDKTGERVNYFTYHQGNVIRRQSFLRSLTRFLDLNMLTFFVLL